jgi:hypothetical protein
MTKRGVIAGIALVAMFFGCRSEPPLVAGSNDSYEFTARVRSAIHVGASEADAGGMLRAQGFDCAHTDTLQSDEGDTLQSHSAADDPGTDYLTCDYLRRRRWGENTRRRYVVVLYIREHRVERVFAVTHLREVQ